jgi:hypothetical protein
MNKAQGRIGRALVAAIMATSIVAASAHSASAATAAENCASKRRKAVGVMMNKKMICHAKAKLSGNPVDAACLQKADTKLERIFTQTAPECPGTAAGISAQADPLIANLLTLIPGTGTCPSKSARVIGKSLKGHLKCRSKEVTSPGSYPICDARSDIVYLTQIAKAGSCGQSPTILGVIHGVSNALTDSLPVSCDSVQVSFTVTAIDDVIFSGDLDLSDEWAGGSETKQVANGSCGSVTVSKPGGNIDLLGAGAWGISGFTGFSSCSGTGGEDGDGCHAPSCDAFAAIGYCDGGRPLCTVALGSGGSTGDFTVQCAL